MTAVAAPGVCLIPVGGSHQAMVDAEDLQVVESYRWLLLKGHNGKLYAHARPRRLPQGSQVGRGRTSIYMHRLIAGTPAGMETDHINGDGLDNRRANLRVATPSQNSANMGKPRRPDGGGHTSRFKGVSWDRARGKWQAKITVREPATGRSRCRNLGRFHDEADAARAYDRAALAAWGEYAQINFSALGDAA